jgi:hypothetical protein
MVDSFYVETEATFTDTGVPFSEWLGTRNLPTANYSVPDTLKLIETITLAATGYKLDPTKTIKGVQSALMGVLRQLSSYSIQLLNKVNTVAIRPLGYASIRTDLDSYKFKYSSYLNISKLGLQRINGKPKVMTRYDANLPNAGYKDSLHRHAKQTMTVSASDINLRVTMNPKYFYRETFYVPTPIVAINTITSNPNDTSKVIGYETYLALNDTQRNTLMDIYLNNASMLTGMPSNLLADVLPVVYNTPDMYIATIAPINYL